MPRLSPEHLSLLLCPHANGLLQGPAYQRPVANVLTKPLIHLLASRKVQWAMLRGWRVAVENIDRLVSDRLISTIFEFIAQELALPVIMKALPCSHRTHQHGSLADVDRVEPDDARVVALVLHCEAGPSNFAHGAARAFR